MRHHIDHLSSSTMEWTQLSDGVYCKMLNHNKDTGDRTGLFRFVPEEGANPPSVCHYHSVFEEIFILEGRMTFDHKTWLGEKGYVFHPPFAVHGFNSAVPEETVFLARSPSDLDFNFPDVPEAKEPFFIDDKSSNRSITYLNPTQEDSWDTMHSPDEQSIGRRLVLNEDSITGEGSSLIRYNSGVNLPAQPEGEETFNEGFILSGRLVAEDGTVWKAGDYWHRHAGKPAPALEVSESTLMFSSLGPI